MKIDFGKIWMARKKPLVVLKKNLGKETNRNETKGRKAIGRNKNIFKKNLPAEQVTSLIRNEHKRNRMWK